MPYLPSHNFAPTHNDNADQQPHYEYRFESVTELAACVAAIPDEKRHNNSSQSTNYETNGFDLKRAVQLGLDGGHWQTGADNLLQAELPEHTALDGYTVKPRMTTETAGFMPNVPAYLSGEPENMFNIQQQPKKHKMISIGINAGRAWNISDSESLNLGRAILAATQQLQQAGYAVAVDVVWYGVCDMDYKNPTHPKPTKRNQLAEIVTTIKRSDQPLSLASLAFAICSTAYCRRLCWSLLESTEGLEKFCANGYGVGVDLVNDKYDLWIPYLSRRNSDKVETPEAAQKWVNDQLAKTLSGEKDGAAA